MKYSQWIGIVAVLAMIISCFLPWTFHPDLNKYFTGFYSEGNNYGKPGMITVFFSLIAFVFFLVPKIWAKRWNLLVTAILLAWGIKNFIVFTGCYRGICPTKQAGLWIMMIASIVTIVMAVVPDVRLKDGKS